MSIFDMFFPLSPNNGYRLLYEEQKRQQREENDKDPINNDKLFYEWCDGPGKEYPRHVEMLSECSAGPVTPHMIWDQGWDAAFKEWAKSR